MNTIAEHSHPSERPLHILPDMTHYVKNVSIPDLRFLTFPLEYEKILHEGM